MDAEHQQVRRSYSRIPGITSSFRQKLGQRILVVGVVIIAMGWSLNNGGLYVHPSIHYQLSCASSRQCVVTIHHAGGGFDHGFNPAYPWTITGDPATSLQFSSTSGTLQANQTVQVRVVIAPGACPTSITISSNMGTAVFGPFVTDIGTGQCTMIEPVEST